MAKKLKGDFFFLSANDLKKGDIVFYGKNGWTSEFDEAIKIPRNKIEFYEGKCKVYEDNCIIISPTFIPDSKRISDGNRRCLIFPTSGKKLLLGFSA